MGPNSGLFQSLKRHAETHVQIQHQGHGKQDHVRLLAPQGVCSPVLLLVGCVEEVALGVPTDGGRTLDHLPVDRVHAPALATLPVHRHLALQGEGWGKYQLRRYVERTTPITPVVSLEIQRRWFGFKQDLGALW